MEQNTNSTSPNEESTHCAIPGASSKKLSRAKPSRPYFLGARFPGVYLTQREAECMINFLKDKTVSEAAAILELSPRTVEFYLKNIKVKLECRTKSELIHKVRESDFPKNYLPVLECEDEN